MRIRNLFALLLVTLISFTLNGRSFAQGQWAVAQTFHIGGEGGWDYITVDAGNHRDRKSVV